MTINKEDIEIETIGQEESLYNITVWYGNGEKKKLASKVANEIDDIMEDIRNLYPQIEKSKHWLKYEQLIKVLRGEK